MSAAAKRGRVILVGAGPGAADLLTLRGAAALARADAVVYDALAPEALLEHATPEARRINVGKRGHDAPTRTQEEINALLVGLARQGLCVVRLKGGDPFVFGRGGEELSACLEAGVPVEVVPGVSSPIGALAYAGIPVTDRRHAASFAVVTGHKDPSKPREEIRWAGLARSADTLIILMGMRNLEEIVSRLLEGGRDPQTPAAVVMEGTTPRQRVVEAGLAELPSRAREAGLTAPAVIVVGEVVRLRERLAWFESLPLFGRRVLVTRRAEQARGMLDALRAAGAEPLLMPAIRIEAMPDDTPLDAALDQLAAYDALLFTSANAVRYFAARAKARGVSLAAPGPQVLAVGPATARAALEAGLPVHARPASRYDAGGLLAIVREGFEPSGRRFLLPRSALGREDLATALEAAGAVVDDVAVYRTLPACFDAESLGGALRAGKIDVLSFASPSAVRFFFEALDPVSRQACGNCVVAAVGPVTARALEAAGFPATLVAPEATGESLVQALSEHFAATGGDS